MTKINRLYCWIRSINNEIEREITAGRLCNGTRCSTVYARSGIIGQHAYERNVFKVDGDCKMIGMDQRIVKRFFLARCILGATCVLLICVGLIFVNWIIPLKKATEDYNNAVLEYNLWAEKYNSLVKTTSIDNLEGVMSSVEKLDFAEINSMSIVMAFLNGNTARKTCADIKIIEELSAYLSEEAEILSQITAPSEEWVIDRLQNVEDVLEIQAVTMDNDPNGLLNKENGGYISCVYFTSTGINVIGDSPVSKGTDGGGCIEVYRSVEDAEERCEYLRGFDNTILYTGSYTIVGTMVIRISYIYTGEAQYEMSDRIVKEFTRLEVT